MLVKELIELLQTLCPEYENLNVDLEGCDCINECTGIKLASDYYTYIKIADIARERVILVFEEST